MSKKIILSIISAVFVVAFWTGTPQAGEVNTAVVGQPYYYNPYYGAPYAYPYAGIAYPGLYSTNPAIQPGSYPSSPFFLGTQVNRATGANVNNAFRATGFLNYAPVPGQGVLAY